MQVNFKININKKLKPQRDWILDDSHQALRTVSKEVTFLDDHDVKIISQMVSYVDACYDNLWSTYKLKPGIAVAAPQMGLNKRIIYINFDDENSTQQKYLLLNPVIKSYSVAKSYLNSGEGCLSVREIITDRIARHYKIVVSAFDILQNKQIEIVASDLLSVCLQHEIDHLDGVLFYDRIDNDAMTLNKKKWIKL